MSESSDRLKAAEENSQRALAPVIVDWIAVAEEVQQIKLELLREAAADSQAQRAAVMIVARVINELRVVALLTQIGYAIEAYSIVATMAELAYTVSFIGNDQNRAERWRAHKFNDTPFIDVYAAVWATIRHNGGTEEQAKGEYAHYEHVCMAKHGNPKVFASFGLTANEDGVVVYHGPYVNREVVHLSRIVLWYACHYAWIALNGYRDFHLPNPQREVRKQQMAGCLHRIGVMRDADVTMYDKEYPR